MSEMDTLQEVTSPTFGSTITILFSDIRGFTEYTDANGDEAAYRMLQRHNSIIQEQVALYGGHVVKTQGDSFMVTFESARTAVTCAIGMQKALHRANEDEQGATIEIGIGINTGEPVREAGDFFGNTVNLASRICSVAGPGQILVSGTVQNLIGRMEGTSYIDRGNFEMKGFQEPQHLFEVEWSGLAGSAGAMVRQEAASAPLPADAKGRPIVAASRSPLQPQAVWAGAAIVVLLIAAAAVIAVLSKGSAPPVGQLAGPTREPLPSEPSKLPPHGHLLYELKLAPPAVNVLPYFMKPDVDRVRVLEDGVELQVAPGSRAGLTLPGLQLDDFVVEMRVRPVSGLGFYGLLFHADSANFHTVRVDAGPGAVSLELWRAGTAQTFGTKLRDLIPATISPALASGDEVAIAVSASGPEMVLFLDGVEIGRAIETTATKGALSFQASAYGRASAPFVTRLLQVKVYGPSRPGAR